MCVIFFQLFAGKEKGAVTSFSPFRGRQASSKVGIVESLRRRKRYSGIPPFGKQKSKQKVMLHKASLLASGVSNAFMRRISGRRRSH